MVLTAGLMSEQQLLITDQLIEGMQPAAADREAEGSEVTSTRQPYSSKTKGMLSKCYFGHQHEYYSSKSLIKST